LSKNHFKALAVLGYHKIGPPPIGFPPTWFYVSEETFIKHLTFLKEEQWAVIDLETFLRGLEQPETLPDRAALLTFDDGCKSTTSAALDCLRRFGFPAVVFVPADYIGKTNLFDAGVEPEEAICNWDDLKELEAAGISIQSHSASHRKFSTLSLVELERELAGSKAALEAGLGKSVTAIAFPFGDSGSDRAETEALLIKAGYRTAFLYGGGPVDPGKLHRYGVSRIAMGPDTNLNAELRRSRVEMLAS
jgi:peptidoglycan/xylan/chitin deacetylase (PgdA/CDA1 family)